MKKVISSSFSLLRRHNTRMLSVEEEPPRRHRMSSQEEDDESDVSEKGGNSSKETATMREPRTGHKRRRQSDVEEKDDVVDDEEEDEEEEDEEDDEEDEDSDEDGATARHRRPRKKQRRANMFLDVEAEVDEDEEELEEEDDELGGEDGFIQEHDLENEEIDAGDDRRHRDLDRKRQEITDKDAERLAEEFREKYGRSAASRYRGDGAGVAQRLLLPSVDDPSIWAIKCKTGKETDIITKLAKKMMVMESRGQSLGITSAFQRDSLEGYIYVEARKAAFVATAVKDIPNVYAAKLILVPIQEMPDLLRVKQQAVDLVPGSYVRIKTKSSKYAGDLAQVDNVDEDGTHARLRLVPRLDFSGKHDVVTPDGKRLKKAPLSFRPPARLFNEAELMYVPPQRISDDRKSGGAKSLGRRGRVFTYLGDDYEDGYLVKDFRISALRIKDVNPTLEEITKFASGTDEADGIDLSSLAAGIKAASKSSTFEAGDLVEVFEGEQAGVHGNVESVTNDIATIISSYSGLKGQRLEVPVRSLRKRFKSGDHVKVVNGRYKDDTGMVVRVVDDQVTILSDMSMKEITVFSKDLSEASQGVNMNTLSKYELHDLVQLDVNTVACIIKIEREAFQVLDQNGSNRTVLPRQISMKIENRKSIATDRDGFEIRIGDTVKEVQGELRQGSILHIHRLFAFVYNREINENLGVFVAKTMNLATVAAKGARINTGPDLNKMNPAMQRRMGPGGGMMPPPPVMRSGGHDRAIGQTVIVRQGPYKGLLGIIKDTTDVSARVELHSNLKTISLEKSKLSFKTPQGNLSYEEFASRGRGSTRDTPQSNPAWGNRTPAVGDFGGRTPAYGGMGSRTPAYRGDGGRTPAWTGGGASSSRTPAWSGGSSGSKTPAWGGSGSKTPAWGGSGSRTPAWTGASGSRTPAWGRDGGRTPARREDTARTPGVTPWDDPKVATPGVWNAPTPGAYAAETPAYTPANFSTNYDTAATPGAQPAQTPGFSGTYNARTPGPNVASTPGYAPASP